jgi:hypothetical protein
MACNMQIAVYPLSPSGLVSVLVMRNGVGFWFVLGLVFALVLQVVVVLDQVLYLQGVICLVCLGEVA